MTPTHELQIKKRLERLVHVILTHSPDKSVSKEEFCRSCAWDVELIIDELESPRQEGVCTAADAIDSYFAARKRILQRIRSRTENDWEEYPEFISEAALR